MDQILKSELTVFPMMDIDVVGISKSSFANYQSSTATNGANALIDIMENVVILVGSDAQE